MQAWDSGTATGASLPPIDENVWLDLKDRYSSEDESELPWLLLWNLRDQLTPTALRVAIHDIWTDTNGGLVDLPGVPESDEKVTRLWQDHWRELFRRAGNYLSYDDPLGEADPCRPTPTTLYRYAEHGAEIGWSWTTSRLKAAAFQHDFSPESRRGCVWKISRIDPSRLLAHFHTKPLPSTSIAITEDTCEDEYVYVADRERDNIEHLEPIEACWFRSAEERASLSTAGVDACQKLYTRFIEDDLTKDELASTLWAVWSGAAHPLEALTKEQWLPMWEAIGYRINSDPAKRPTESLVLHRGSDAAHRDNWSWTTKVDVAWQAAGADGQVWTATIPPERLLARIIRDDYDESEYVARPEGLKIEPHLTWSERVRLR